MGYKAGVCLGYRLEYTYLAQYCLISFALPYSCSVSALSVSDTGADVGGTQDSTGLPVTAQLQPKGAGKVTAHKGFR